MPKRGSKGAVTSTQAASTVPKVLRNPNNNGAAAEGGG